MSSGSKRYGEYVQDKTRASDRDQIKARINNAVEAANKELARGNHPEAGRLLNDVIIDGLRELDYTKRLRTYHHDLHHDDAYRWYWSEFRRFMQAPSTYIDAVTDTPGDRESQRVIERAVASAESISSYVDITANDLRHEVDVEGFSGKLGEWLRDPEKMHDIGDPVRAVTTQAGALKTLFLGGTGSGKSTGVETEVEDFYQKNFREGEKDTKIIDLAGLRDGENWFYDVPQQQPALRDIRAEMGLPETFRESDAYGTPEMEVLLPLTPGLSREQLPYDTDAGGFVPRPFVVPASEIPKTLMISFISSRLSEGQEEAIRSTYESVDRREDDWCLRDLADELRDRDELSAKDRATGVNVLRSLQDTGFIRTNAHDRCLDWRAIMADNETITVFSQAKCPNKVSRYIAFAYLLYSAVHEREQMVDVPQCVLVARELWKLAPHNQRQSDFEEIAALQEGIATTFSELFRENRHSGIHLVADTQQPSDLHKSVREMFNRYVVYNTDKETLKDIFSWTYNWRYESFWKTLSAATGEAGIVGQIEPAVEERDIEFLSPVRYAPPSHHHRVTPGDDVGITPDLTGWHGRCRHHDHEELRYPAEVDDVDWDDEVPPELDVEPAENPADAGPQPATEPVAAFVEACTYVTDIGSYTHKSDLYDAFNEFLREHNEDTWDLDRQGRKVQFGKEFTAAFPEEIKNMEKEGEYAFVGVGLNREGKRLLRATRTEVKSSASPIRSDS